jgi:hypothetical protein
MLAKACSRRPEDGWIGEVFLTVVVAVVGFVVWSQMLLFSVWALISFLEDGSGESAFLWLVVTLGFPVAACCGGRLVRRCAHPPVARRLYVLGVSGALVMWSGVIPALYIGAMVVAVLTGQLVPV